MTEKIQIRRPYDGTRVRRPVSFSLPSLTKQSFKEDCDINVILERFSRTGIFDHVSKQTPRFIDCVDTVSYLDAMTTITEADEAFMALPAHVRRHFDNDPAEFLFAFQDPDRREELLDLGLLEAPSVPETDPPSPAPKEPPPAEGDSKDS